MKEFRMVRGFEDLWRPPVRPRIKRPEGGSTAQPDVRTRLARVAARTPEVMVKVTGRTRDPAHLAAHLTYITRNGELAAEGRDRWVIAGRREVLDLARDWSDAQLFDTRRRTTSPFSVAVMLSMPAGTDAIRLWDAARAFAEETFGDRFDYVFALHTDTPHPHVHLAVRALGDDGSRLNPKKTDLEAWRQRFAERLRERGVAAEATPRRARGVTRKAERTAVRKLRERGEAGKAPVGRVQRARYQEAARIAFGGERRIELWETAIVARQRQTRGLLLAQARLLQSSGKLEDQDLGRDVEAFVRSMPAPDTQTLALARILRAANERLRNQELGEPQTPDRGKDRR